MGFPCLDFSKKSSSPGPPSTALDTDKASSKPADFNGEINTNNDTPSSGLLTEIGNLPILSETGESVPFGSLYPSPETTSRVLIIFIRHFFCGNCQDYLLTISAFLLPFLQSASPPITMHIIGCGSPKLIPSHREITTLPASVRVFADPTAALYEKLGMKRTLEMGVWPAYQQNSTTELVRRSFMQSLRKIGGGEWFKGGDYRWVGGEFLLEKGDDGGEVVVKWCHRMRTTRDHAEIGVLKEVLGLDAAEDGLQKGEESGTDLR